MSENITYNEQTKTADADVKRKIEKQREYYVVKHNDIIQKQTFDIKKKNARSLTTTEQKIFLYIISKIKPDETEIRDITFDVKTFCNVVGLEARGSSYQNIKNAIEDLMSRVVYIEEENKTYMVNLIHETIINKGDGRITIKLHERIKPYVISLYDNYTQYALRNVLAFKSKYSFMLYELLKSYQYKHRYNTIFFEVEELKNKLDCLNYESFTNFVNKVLTPAITEINKFTDLEVKANLIKTGRKYTTIEFTIKQLDGEKDVKEYIKRTSRTQKELEPDKKTMYEFYYGELDNE